MARSRTVQKVGPLERKLPGIVEALEELLDLGRALRPRTSTDAVRVVTVIYEVDEVGRADQSRLLSPSRENDVVVDTNVSLDVELRAIEHDIPVWTGSPR